MRAFTSAAAQFDNLGDLVLRRTLVGRLARQHEVHVYLGGADPSYVEALALPPTAVTYRSYGRWIRTLAAAGPRGALVYAPGEQLLDDSAGALVRAVSQIAVSTGVRVRGGRVAKIGRGYARVTPAGLWLERRALALCQLAVLRDTTSAELVHRPFCPDVALDWRPPPVSSARRLLTLSLRADRSQDVDLVRAAAPVVRETGMPVTVAVQVRRDEHSADRWAQEWGGEVLAWGGRSHVDQLAAVCHVYSSSQVVLSNRLHVLYFALVNGAVPVALSPTSGSKVAEGLGSLGLGELVVQSPGDVGRVLASLAGDPHALSERCAAALARARQVLDTTWADLGALIDGGESPALG